MRLVVGSGGEIQRRRRPGFVAVPESDAPEAVDHDWAAARVGQLTDRCEVPGGVLLEGMDVTVAEVPDEQVARELAESGRCPRQPPRRVEVACACDATEQMTALVSQALSEGTPIAVSLTNTLNAVTSNQAARLASGPKGIGRRFRANVNCPHLPFTACRIGQDWRLNPPDGSAPLDVRDVEHQIFRHLALERHVEMLNGRRFHVRVGVHEIERQRIQCALNARKLRNLRASEIAGNWNA